MEAVESEGAIEVNYMVQLKRCLRLSYNLVVLSPSLYVVCGFYFDFDDLVCAHDHKKKKKVNKPRRCCIEPVHRGRLQNLWKFRL